MNHNQICACINFANIKKDNFVNTYCKEFNTQLTKNNLVFDYAGIQVSRAEPSRAEPSRAEPSRAHTNPAAQRNAGCPAATRRHYAAACHAHPWDPDAGTHRQWEEGITGQRGEHNMAAQGRSGPLGTPPSPPPPFPFPPPQGLYKMVDFIGVSAYPAMVLGQSTLDIESPQRMNMVELSGFGVYMQQLIGEGREVIISETGGCRGQACRRGHQGCG
jgi:hypothetical protein